MTEGRLAWDTAAVICLREARGGPGSAGRVTSGPGLSEGTRTLGVPQPQRRNYSRDKRTAGPRSPAGAAQAVTQFVSSDLSLRPCHLPRGGSRGGGCRAQGGALQRGL